MKPRLEVAPLTDEDFAIVVDHGGDARRAYFLGTLLAHTRGSDRRDADLMFWCQRYRSYTFPVDLPPLTWSWFRYGTPIDCGGALAEWKTLNITYFA